MKREPLSLKEGEHEALKGVLAEVERQLGALGTDDCSTRRFLVRLRAILSQAVGLAHLLELLDEVQAK